MKCLNCDNKAKWKSTKYPSPLCSRCARIEVDKLLATGNFNLNESDTKTFYDFIDNNYKGLGSTQDPITGKLIKLNREDILK